MESVWQPGAEAWNLIMDLPGVHMSPHYTVHTGLLPTSILRLLLNYLCPVLSFTVPFLTKYSKCAPPGSAVFDLLIIYITNHRKIFIRCPQPTQDTCAKFIGTCNLNAHKCQAIHQNPHGHRCLLSPILVYTLHFVSVHVLSHMSRLLSISWQWKYCACPTETQVRWSKKAGEKNNKIEMKNLKLKNPNKARNCHLFGFGKMHPYWNTAWTQRS